MFDKKILGGAALTALTLAITPPVLAQETTSSIGGTVESTDGQPVSGAKVTVRHLPTGTTSVEEVSGGVFGIRGLRVGGPYTIEVSGDFETQTLSDVYVDLGSPFKVQFVVQPSMEIVVTASKPVGATVVTGSGTRFSRDEIAGVVSINRDIRDIARRDPLVVQNRSDGGLLIAGSNPRSNRITIDGVQAQDNFGLNTGGLPTRRGPISIDAIEQLTVQAVPFDVINGSFNGGAIDIVLRQGTNDFHGSVFANYLNDGLVGTRLEGVEQNRDETQDNYGASLFGPILKDKLFFGLTYESYESADATTFPAFVGPRSTQVGATTTVVPPSSAEIASVTDVLRNTYGSNYPFGTLAETKPIEDEKYTARLDWNITDNHRASLTYRNSESTVFNRTNLGTTTAALDSQWYFTGEKDNTYAVQINSNWTDRLSTELRVSRRDYTRLQEPPAGQNFSDVRVCSTATSAVDTSALTAAPTLNCRNGGLSVLSVRFGADQFRHANYLTQATDAAQFTAVYDLGRHSIKAGVQWETKDIFNLFLPNSLGTYYFDSVQEFGQGRASQLIYRNALTNDPTDAAANFEYSVLSGLVQDRFDVNDKLTLSAGVRWDHYSANGDVARNPNFVARYGFDNRKTYDDLDVFMPRFSFDWEATEKLQISGGLGLFSGGLPDVFLSNSYSNTGVRDNTLQFERRRVGTTSATPTVVDPGNSAFYLTETTGGVNCATNAQICVDALNVPVNSGAFRRGFIPARVQAALGGTTPVATSETNSIAPDFEIPSDWRANVKFEYQAPYGVQLGFDGVYYTTNEGLAFRDLRAQPLIINGQRGLTPDGRLRYDGLGTGAHTTAGTVSSTGAVQRVTSTNPGTSRDIQAFNPGKTNTGYTLAFSAAKDWDNGLSVFGVYTVQDLTEFSASARFSSTASSLYGGQYASFDPNVAVRGRGQEDIEEAFKADISWRREFVSDLETRVSLFADWRTGRPLTFLMNASRDVFGVNRGSQLAYIPNFAGWNGATTTLPNDSKVVFDSAATAQAVQSLVTRFELPQGGTISRGSNNNPEVTRADLQISQDLPTFTPWNSDKLRLTFDIFNFGNLLNDDWGLNKEYGESLTLFSVSCSNAAGATTDAAQTECSRYRITNASNQPTLTPDLSQSRWAIQIGLKYEF